VALAGAWPAELVGVAQPAMRRVLVRTPPGLERGNRSRHADERHCTTRRHNAHRTEVGQEREVVYPWHPWAGCVVRVHEAVGKVGGTVLRCSRDSEASGRWLELPVWMFDRAACLAVQITSAPVVEFAALVALQELLAVAAAARDVALSSNTPVSSPTDEARNQNRGKDDATANSMSCEGSQTSSAARPVRRTGVDDRGLADASLASTAGRDATVADGIDVAAPARPPSPRTPPLPDGGDR
jgi:hypothetical protein